eukprot:1136893-Pelagomonas_calceolata.AAC.5
MLPLRQGMPDEQQGYKGHKGWPSARDFCCSSEGVPDEQQEFCTDKMRGPSAMLAGMFLAQNITQLLRQKPTLSVPLHSLMRFQKGAVTLLGSTFVR